ncbi:hypothetical protein HAX54_025382, partial [Datura stramonium]|nr:hypothetical protein [Datura stramonium]
MTNKLNGSEVKCCQYRRNTSGTQVKTPEAPLSRRSFIVEWGHNGHPAPHWRFAGLDPKSVGETQ